MEIQTRDTSTATGTERSRWWLVALILLALVAIGGVIWAISISDGDDALPDAIEQREGSMMAGDAAAMAALYTEDGFNYDPGLSLTWRGRDELESGMSSIFDSVTFSDMELISVEETADSFVTQWRMGGTRDGQEFTVDVEATFVLDGDLIASVELVYDPDDIWY